MELSLLPLGHQQRLSSLSISKRRQLFCTSAFAYLTLIYAYPHPTTLSIHVSLTLWFLSPAAKPRRSYGKPSSVLFCFCSADTYFSESGGRRALVGLMFVAGLNMCRVAEAISSSRRALRGAKVPESDFTTLPNGISLLKALFFPDDILKIFLLTGQTEVIFSIKPRFLIQEALVLCMQFLYNGTKSF
ncbi:Peptidyl-prolyl cis-trans isomerase FKBP16-4, chloroplastic [Dendrobium catenatum]|uniref:Peptidyl-prolyl cis-trans isomerase FKBP16-4, chloroplastic n=1 Tax=Dendrobium catenatum TaxID=906689 RepID=A0A2I0VIK0_9ASPA|nr:Peptidyl-prolyl cis-trans isomerase FKBP16-4, chloroplastic [Dendrobium catenatum]